MPAQNSGVIITGSVAAAANAIFANAVLPAYTLIIVDVLTYLAGGPSTPTLSDTAGLTWVQVATFAATTGGAGARRLTRFRTMVAVETATVITATGNGVAQTAIGWEVRWCGGVDVSGTFGSGAVGPTATYESGITSVTTVPPGGLPITPSSGNVNLAYLAAFANSAGASLCTPRTNWTEGSDFQLAGAAARYQSQYIANPDTEADLTCGSGTLVGIVTEIKCIVSPVSCRRALGATADNITPPVIVPVTLLGGRWHRIILTAGENGAITAVVPTASGVTFTQELNTFGWSNSGLADTRVSVYRFKLAADATVHITLSFPGAVSLVHYSYNIVELANLDETIGGGTGVVQSAPFPLDPTVVTTRSCPLPATIGPQNAVLIIAHIENSPTANTVGFQTISYQVNGGGHDTGTIVTFRANGDAIPKLTTGGAFKAVGIVYELAQTPTPVDEPVLPPPAAPILETIGGDIKLQWADGSDDMVIEDDDIAADLGLRTSVLLSLFTDRRAEDDDVLPSDDGDRRGWWGDAFSAVEGDRIGSRLWLLARSKRSEDVVQRAEELVREALAWMLEDRVASRLDVEVETGTKELLIAITLHRPTGDPVALRFTHAWEAP